MLARRAVVVPLGLRAVNRAVRPPDAAPSYIPSIESPRVRAPFDSEAVAALREAANDYILIGDSMAGTRIDPGHLSRLIGGHGAAALFHPGSGRPTGTSTFKNLVVNAGLQPRAVVFFFRDENLTDTLFRVYPSALDRVAKTRNPCSTRSSRPARRARSTGCTARSGASTSTTGRAPGSSPSSIRAPVAWSAGRRGRKKLLDDDQQRGVHARGAAAHGGRRHGRGARRRRSTSIANLPTSVLPEILRLSKMSGIRVAFVRVQRRPAADGPPAAVAPRSQGTCDAPRRYLEANGAVFHDDWGDPDQPLSVYEDGDHVKKDFRRIYTEMFFRKNPEIFR